MKVLNQNHCNTRRISFHIVLLSLCINISTGFSQAAGDPHKIYFISDCQEPMKIEKMIFTTYRNEEATDSLFADIIRQRPLNLFMLGDLVSEGSNEKAWGPLDSLLKSLKQIHTSVYAIPGNHEYMGKIMGMRMFTQRFNPKWLLGYDVTIDSVTMVMLNSNFTELDKKELSKQLTWYRSVMDSLDADPAVKAIIVCIHHAPYSNSEVVGSSKPVQDMLVPAFERSRKAKLFISGHSHNLEYFSDSIGKHFLVIGGGGGITQPLTPENKRKYHDLLDQDTKPLYFYLVMEINAGYLKLSAKGFKRDFRFFEREIGILPLK
jgi:hypothetical protein